MSRVKTGIQLDVDQFIAPNADVLFKLTEAYVDKAFLGKRWRGSEGARKRGGMYCICSFWDNIVNLLLGEWGYFTKSGDSSRRSRCMWALMIFCYGHHVPSLPLG